MATSGGVWMGMVFICFYQCFSGQSLSLPCLPHEKVQVVSAVSPGTSAPVLHPTGLHQGLEGLTRIRQSELDAKWGHGWTWMDIVVWFIGPGSKKNISTRDCKDFFVATQALVLHPSQVVKHHDDLNEQERSKFSEEIS